MLLQQGVRDLRMGIQHRPVIAGYRVGEQGGNPCHGVPPPPLSRPGTHLLLALEGAGGVGHSSPSPPPVGPGDWLPLLPSSGAAPPAGHAHGWGRRLRSAGASGAGSQRRLHRGGERGGPQVRFRLNVTSRCHGVMVCSMRTGDAKKVHVQGFPDRTTRSRCIACHCFSPTPAHTHQHLGPLPPAVAAPLCQGSTCNRSHQHQH